MVGLCPVSSIKHYTRLKTKDNKRYTSPPTKILPMNSIPTPAKTHIICKKRERVSRTLDGPKYHVMERNISNIMQYIEDSRLTPDEKKLLDESYKNERQGKLISGSILRKKLGL